MNGIPVCVFSKKVERPYPRHYWIIRFLPFFASVFPSHSLLCLSFCFFLFLILCFCILFPITILVLFLCYCPFLLFYVRFLCSSFVPLILSHPLLLYRFCFIIVCLLFLISFVSIIVIVYIIIAYTRLLLYYLSLLLWLYDWLLLFIIMISMIIIVIIPVFYPQKLWTGSCIPDPSWTPSYQYNITSLLIIDDCYTYCYYPVYIHRLPIIITIKSMFFIYCINVIIIYYYQWLYMIIKYYCYYH